jgi:transcriptional regulator with XRE-family HTH domain
MLIVHRNTDKLGSVIKAARLEKNITQAQLSAQLGITTRHLISIENNKRKPSYDLLFQLIRELEISANAIFYPEFENRELQAEKLKILIDKCDEKEVGDIITTLQILLEKIR